MATKKALVKSTHPKKEFKKELAVKIETVLSELKSMLGEKEFENRLKKAAKVLAHGLHSKDFSAGNNGTAKSAHGTSKKVNVAKKASAKKIKSLKKAKTKDAPAAPVN